MGGTWRSLAGQHVSVGLQRFPLILIMLHRCLYGLDLQVTGGFRTQLWEGRGDGAGRAVDSMQAEGMQRLMPSWNALIRNWGVEVLTSTVPAWGAE